jgi:DNA-binding winged helix-turn-helix (wHTH) protein
MAEPARISGYRFGIFELKMNERRLLVGSQAVALGPRAFDVLVALVERAGGLVTKEELLARVWPDLVVEENNLQVQVSALRKILGQQAIATIPGRGYRFTAALTGVNAAGAGSTLLAPIDDTVQSIAVLPFVNMSDDAANEYFADGISEELSQRAVQDPRPAGGVAYVGVQLQGRQGRHPDGRAEAQRGNDP